jgi:hypothetical protein
MGTTPRLPEERRGLRPGQRVIVRAFAEAMLSDADDRGRPIPPDPVWVERVVDEYDKTVGADSPVIRRGVAAIAMALDTLPAVVIGLPRRMSRLPLAERIAYLEALESSRLGLISTLLASLKIPIVMIAYDEGEALALTGFDRPDLTTPRGRAPILEPKGPLVCAARKVAS